MLSQKQKREMANKKYNRPFSQEVIDKIHENYYKRRK